MRNFTRNPFLVVGVSADAEMTEIRRVAQRRMMECRLEGGENSPEARRVETALEQLQDPVQRFTWGLYWPELTAEEAERFRNDPVLSTLGEDPLQDGAAAYERICGAGAGEVRSHNLGVLSLLQAVAATEEAQKGTPDDISDDLACCDIWRRAFRHLALAEGSGSRPAREPQRARSETGASTGSDSAAFWLRKRLWAKELGDKRLSEAQLKEIRESYAADLLAPAGSVVTTALLDGHAEVAKAYVEVIRSSGFVDEIVEGTLSRVYKPLADRVERVVQDLSARAEGMTTSSGLSALLAEFERDALGDLELMIAVGDLPGYAEEHARDTAATLLRSIAIDAWNHTNDAPIAERAVQLASRIADSDSLIAQLDQDRAALKVAAAGKEQMEQLMKLLAKIQRVATTHGLDEARYDIRRARNLVDQLIAQASGEARDRLQELRHSLDKQLRRTTPANGGSRVGCIVLVFVAYFIINAVIGS